MTTHPRHPSRRPLNGLALAALILGLGAQVFAQPQEDWRLNKDFLKAFGRDFASVVTSPLHWNNRDLGRFALVSVATLAVVPFEEEIRDWAQAHRTDSSQDVATFFEKFGNGAYLVGFAAALYAGGEIWHSRGVRRTALLSFESLATASVIVWTTKFVVGRARPRTGHNNHKFHPFSFSSEYNSFPSGHTAAAFAVATTIARETRGVAVDVLAYSIATLVGFSRIHDNQHWASSVIAGAALGYFVGRKISGRHPKGEAARNLDLGISLGPGGSALTLTYVF